MLVDLEAQVLKMSTKTISTYVYKAFLDLRSSYVFRFTEEELENSGFDKEEILHAIMYKQTYENYEWRRTKEEIPFEEDIEKTTRESLIKKDIEPLKKGKTLQKKEIVLQEFSKSVKRIFSLIEKSHDYRVGFTKNKNLGIYRGKDNIAVFFCSTKSNASSELKYCAQYDSGRIDPRRLNDWFSTFLRESLIEHKMGKKITLLTQERNNNGQTRSRSSF